jgi:hypothetical protein
MNISAKLGVILAAIFALFCLGFAITGFLSLSDVIDPVKAADAKGFAWFWTFLAGVAIVFGALSWWIGKAQPRDGDR